MTPNADWLWRLPDLGAAWALTYLVHSSVIILVVWAVTSRRFVSDTVRDVLWKAALVGGLVTATVQTSVTREPLGGQVSVSSLTRPTKPAVRLAISDNVNTGTRRMVVMQPGGTRWTGTVLVLWMASAGIALLLLTRGHTRTLGALGERSPLDGTPIGDRLVALLARVRIDRPVALTCSRTASSPLALPGGEICIPRRALVELPLPEQDSMLAHEVAHVVRRDPEWLVVARAIETILFFQPLNRLARRRLQEVAEYLCDDWAVARTSQPVTLAKCLAAVAEWVGCAPKIDGHAMSAMVESGGSPLVRRVGRILRGRSGSGERSPMIAILGSACALVVLAGVAPRISIAHAAPSADKFAFVRAVIDARGPMASRDSLLIVPRRMGASVIGDSLVRRSGTVAAGAIFRRDDVVFERVVIDATPDSAGNVVWTRVARAVPIEIPLAGPRAPALIKD